MDDDFPIAGFLLIIGLLFFLLFIGSKLGRITERGSFQKEAIEQGVAEYNQTTGDWQWKNEKQ